MEKQELYNQTALAAALGVNRRTIHRWESENKIIRFGTGWKEEDTGPARGWCEAEVEILRQWQAGEIGHAEMYAAQAKARRQAIDNEIDRLDRYKIRGHIIRLLFPNFGPGATEADEQEVFDRVATMTDPANCPTDEVADAQMAIERAACPPGTEEHFLIARVVIALDAKRAAADLL